jgi:hypothetical protein
MRVEEAERHLNDYLLNGIAAEIFWAEEAYALAEKSVNTRRLSMPPDSLRCSVRYRPSSLTVRP